MRIRLNPLPVMSVLSVIALVILIMFGQWQWSRYQEKRLLRAVAPSVITLDPVTPIPEAVQFVFGLRDGMPGWRVMQPVRYGDRIVFIDAEYISGGRAPELGEVSAIPALAAGVPVSGVVVRPKAESAFAAPNDPERHVWYEVNPQAMARAAGLDNVEDYIVAIPYLGPTGAAYPNPFAVKADPLPPERHLGYALTWWGLAAALVGVYLAFHYRQGRLVITPKPKAET